MKELLLKEIEKRNLNIEFDDIDESIAWLEELVLSTGNSEEKVINDFIQYCLENYMK